MKPVTRYQIEYSLEGGSLYYAHGGYPVPSEDEPEELVSSVDYDTLHKDYDEAVAALRMLSIAYQRKLMDSGEHYMDEPIKQAEAVLNKA